MVIRGRTRGKGKQLAQYLLAMNENEDVQILDIVGRGIGHDGFLHETLLSMSLTSELTKSDKGLYHAQINPAHGEDKAMTPETWVLAASLLENELGLVDQRRVIVLYKKKNRTHAHVVWERFDHERGIMRSDSFSRLAQDRARREMEQVFQHQPTPHRNQQRPEMKQILTRLWQQSPTGKEFISEVDKTGYVIAAGLQRRPFMVVDNTGRSFDLLRQLDGVKTREVRERLKGEKLIPEKIAIVHRRDSEAMEFERRKKETARKFVDTSSDIFIQANDQVQKTSWLRKDLPTIKIQVNSWTRKRNADVRIYLKNCDRQRIASKAKASNRIRREDPDRCEALGVLRPAPWHTS